VRFLVWELPTYSWGSGKLPTLVDILERREIQAPVRYGITCRKAFPHLEPADYLDLAFSTSAGIIQLREKDLRAGNLRQLVAQGVRLARTERVIFFVNGEVRMALKEGADGVHLRSRQSITKARQVRRESGVRNFVIGKSVHSVLEAVTAEDEGADYVMLGPIFPPISKTYSTQPLGWSVLREAAQMLYIPVIAVGGIDSVTKKSVLTTHAFGEAGISWIKEEIEPLAEGNVRLRSPS
jgi:thiamine-phosphate pyrophosphorylase